MKGSSLDWTATEAVVGRIQDRIFRAAKIKRPRLEPDDEQSSCPVLRGLGSGNGARLPNYVYGRRPVGGHGRPARRTPSRVVGDWQVRLKGRLPAYIGWHRFEENQAQFRANQAK